MSFLRDIVAWVVLLGCRSPRWGNSQRVARFCLSRSLHSANFVDAQGTVGVGDRDPPACMNELMLNGL
ncbi:hypothetical protein [Pantanalinema sp. GBBB05]|uniref:hypothetical protein n=1 Tax=Pantanalinema sp. GBBB05 TaxID=2604139 RepID=UPI001E1A2399|nr:hypothetical protein [Pantanalinema sp. GBBB05]